MLEIVGWAFDSILPEKVSIELIDICGNRITAHFTDRIYRPDVVAIHPTAFIQSGFRAIFEFNSIMTPLNFYGEIPFSVQFTTSSSLRVLKLHYRDNFEKVNPRVLYANSGMIPCSHEDYIRGINFFDDLALTDCAYKLDVIFDVGANVGQSLKSIFEALPYSKIYCFEPNPDVYRKLCENIPVRGFIRCENIALGDNRKHSFVTKKVDSVNNQIIDIDLEILGQYSEDLDSCEVITGDEYCAVNNIHKIDLLKIDTEGFDLKVLHGFQEMISRSKINFIECECGMNSLNTKHAYFMDIFNFLIPHGYDVFGIYEQVREGNSKFLRRTNIMFMKK